MATEKTFKVGDIVALRSGSPQMTVREAELLSNGNGQYIKANWYEGGSFKDQSFYASMLEMITEA